MKATLKLLAVLLLFLTLSSQKLSRSNDSTEWIGVIYINDISNYTLVYYEIDVSCAVWWQNHLKIDIKLNPKPMENIYLHTINGNPIIGHICNS